MPAALKTWLVRLLKFTAWAVGSFVFLAWLLTTFYSAEIKQLIVGELNKSLASPVQVGDINFSILRHFPFAAVELRQVKASDAPASGPKATLLEAEKISLLFNITGLFSKDLSVREIVMEEGSLHILIDKDGHDNYHIWKTSADTSSSVIDLQKIVLRNVHITYHDLFAVQDYSLNAHEATLKGRFASDEFTLDVTSDLFVQQLRMGAVNYLAEKEVKLNTTLSVNSAQRSYRFGESTITIAGLHFSVQGEVIDDTGGKGMYTDLVIHTQKGSLEELISLMPEQYAGYFSKYKSRGRVALDLAIKGGGMHNKHRDVNMSFTVEDGKLTPPHSSVSLSALNFSGTYRSNPGGEDVLSIPHLSANLNGHAVEAGLQLSRLSQPWLNLKARADLDLADIRTFLRTDTVESLAGRLRLDVSVAGKLSDMESGDLRSGKVVSSGTIQLSDASMRLKHNTLDFRGINGLFRLHDSNLDIQQFAGNVSSTDFAVSGTLHNLVNYLLVPGQPVSLDGHFASKHMDLDELIVTKNEDSAGDTTYLLKFNPRLVCNFRVNVDNLQFRKFKADGITGTIHLENQVISSPDLAFRSMGGTAKMNATINASLRDKVTMACDADIAGIDITEMFTELENFDQQTLTDRNLKGRIDASVKFTSDWSKDLVIRPSSAKAQCSIVIENGELNHFTPILALSKYLKLADLNNIRFSTLKNEINISDRKIYIPAMEIRSSALNLTASGVHDFDNMVDYRLKMLLSDVLGKKVKQQSEFGEIEDDGLGRWQLLLTMKGPVDDPKFAYDRKGVGEKIRNDLAADRQNVKQMLKQEFGLFKKDTTHIQPKPKKKEELQVDWDASN